MFCVLKFMQFGGTPQENVSKVKYKFNIVAQETIRTNKK